MLWSEIKKWSKEQGFEVKRNKNIEQDCFIYQWNKEDNKEINGETFSLSKLATAIYNNITNNKWVDHQIEYKNNLNIEIDPNGT